jgi:oligopeptide transport system substrate-binding protein
LHLLKYKIRNMYGRTAPYFLLCLFIFFSCRTDKHQYTNVFYWNIAEGFNSMDPAFARIQANIWVVNQMFNGLVELDDSLNTVPSIARSWEISEDGKTYTGGKGRLLKAQDFVYSFNRIVDPATASPGAWIFNDIVDFEAPEGGFSAPNDSTFVIKLVRPFRPFLQMLTLKYASVVPKEAVEVYGKDFRTHPVGTGPFYLKYYIPAEQVVLHKNKNYFKEENGKNLPYLDAVVISFVSNKQTEFFKFIKGELSLLVGLDQSFKDNLLSREGTLKKKWNGQFQLEVYPYLNTEYLGIMIDTSLSKSPVVTRKIRQAISYGIDRKKMIRYLRNSVGDPGNDGFVPPSLLTDTSYYQYNPDKARQLLKEAGYPEGKGMPPVQLSTTENYLDMAIYVQKQLEDLGIKLSINNVPGATLSEMKAQGKAEFFRGSWIADYADPENYLSLFYSKNFSPNGPNYFHYSDSDFDRLYEQALLELDNERRMSLYRQMQKLVMDDAPVVVLFYDKVVRLKQNNVKGLGANPINLISLEKVYLK